jgi:signal transduction histidine kinase/CheY-like chemotaxis protein
MDALRQFLDPSRFMPHGMCFQWQPDLLVLHAGADLLIAAAYFSIPAAMLLLLRGRDDVPRGVFLLFVSFILLCGVTHLASMVVIWIPAYYVEGIFKLATAGVSVTTAFVLWPLLPRALSVPSRTAMQERNREIEELNRRLERRVESLDVMAGGVAHQLNNLLTVIQGRMQFLEDDATDAEGVEAIRSAVARAADISRKMQAFSGRGHFTMSSVDLDPIVQAAAEEAGRGAVALELDGDLPPVRGSARQLHQLVAELVTNAREASGEEEAGDPAVVLSTHARHLETGELEGAAFGHEMDPGPAVVLRVRDRGAGMTKTTRRRMFEPFFSTRFTGRGLGLAAVQGIVRGHGGCVFVESGVGRGTTVEVALPVAEGAEAEGGGPVDRREGGTGPGHALVVDDEEEVLGVAGRYLERLGFRVTTTSDPEAALLMVDEAPERFDLVVADYLMPGMNGLELLRRIEARAELELYLTSGYSRGEIEDPDLESGLTAFIPKPFDLSDLRSALGLDNPSTRAP